MIHSRVHLSAVAGVDSLSVWFLLCESADRADESLKAANTPMHEIAENATKDTLTEK